MLTYKPLHLKQIFVVFPPKTHHAQCSLDIWGYSVQGQELDFAVAPFQSRIFFIFRYMVDILPRITWIIHFFPPNRCETVQYVGEHPGPGEAL